MIFNWRFSFADHRIVASKTGNCLPQVGNFMPPCRPGHLWSSLLCLWRTGEFTIKAQLWKHAQRYWHGHGEKLQRRVCQACKGIDLYARRARAEAFIYCVALLVKDRAIHCEASPCSWTLQLTQRHNRLIQRSPSEDTTILLKFKKL